MCVIVYTYAVVPNCTLIALSATTFSFAPSSNVAVVMAYQVFLYASYSSSVIASAVATFTYLNPCLSTLPIPVAFTSITTTVLAIGSAVATMWNDAASVAGGVINGCGPINFVVSVLTSPATYVSATMSSIFALTSTSGTVSISVSPTNPLEIGDYSLSTKGCLANYPLQCASTTTAVTINPCAVTSVEVV